MKRFRHKRIPNRNNFRLNGNTPNQAWWLQFCLSKNTEQTCGEPKFSKVKNKKKNNNNNKRTREKQSQSHLKIAKILGGSGMFFFLIVLTLQKNKVESDYANYFPLAKKKVEPLKSKITSASNKLNYCYGITHNLKKGIYSMKVKQFFILLKTQQHIEIGSCDSSK